MLLSRALMLASATPASTFLQMRGLTEDEVSLGRRLAAVTLIDTALSEMVATVLAASTKVVDPYFTLPVARGANSVAEAAESVLRERVYAYELYHQLRSLDARSRFTLTAEPDKRGHPVIKDRSNPDFVFHFPGSMTENVAILEVKRATSVDVKSDLAKFHRYLTTHSYHHCLWLVFGDVDDGCFEHRFASPFRLSGLSGHLLWHRESGAEPKVIL